MKSIKSELGQYYIGDLCYVFKDADWDNFCSSLFEAEENSMEEEDMKNVKEVIFKTQDGKEVTVLCASTQYGDGWYKGYANFNSFNKTDFLDSNYLNFPVDAGLIGIAKIEDICVEMNGNELHGKEAIPYIQNEKLGHILTTKNEVLHLIEDGKTKKEVDCYYCGGNGYISDYTDDNEFNEEPCDYCNGEGYHYEETEVRNHIFEFNHYHINDKIRMTLIIES